MAQGLKAGTLLDHGMYRVERILGSGGFGITYLVTDLGLDKLRAMKEFFPKDYCDRDDTTSHVTLGTSNTAEFVDKLKKKFIKEARNISHLDQHSGIITIHRVFEENNTAYYVMDYIEGENLSEIVKREGSLPINKSIKYITEVGNALEYVHKHHINHLDIKPANIMIRRTDDSPILIDFGLSKQYDSEGLQTSTTPTGISHGYAPIEQYHDGGVKEFYPQTDVYSLAATLYYLVSGKIPTHATSLTQNDLTFPDGFPYFLKSPISKAMSTKRGHRHETVKEFIATLKPEDESTVIEIPNKHQDVHLPENRNRILSSSESNNVISSDFKGNKNKGDKTRGRKKYNFPAYFKKHKNAVTGFILFICGMLGVCLLAKFVFNNKKDNINSLTIEDNPLKEITEDSVNNDKIQNINEVSKINDENIPKYIENKKYKASWGEYMYTGNIDKDGLPHGFGIAKWENGFPIEGLGYIYEGKRIYKGNWEHGKMEGKGEAKINGDSFVGIFKNNQFLKGKYIYASGKIFEGTFKFGDPYEGKIYDKNNSLIENYSFPSDIQNDSIISVNALRVPTFAEPDQYLDSLLKAMDPNIRK